MSTLADVDPASLKQVSEQGWRLSRSRIQSRLKIRLCTRTLFQQKPASDSSPRYDAHGLAYVESLVKLPACLQVYGEADETLKTTDVREFVGVLGATR